MLLFKEMYYYFSSLYFENISAFFQKIHSSFFNIINVYWVSFSIQLSVMLNIYEVLIRILWPYPFVSGKSDYLIHKRSQNKEREQKYRKKFWHVFERQNFDADFKHRTRKSEY